MPSRAQKGFSIKESFDQQAAHRPAPSPSGSRQDGHSGVERVAQHGAQRIGPLRGSRRAIGLFNLHQFNLAIKSVVRTAYSLRRLRGRVGEGEFGHI